MIFTFSTCEDVITCTLTLSQAAPFFFPRHVLERCRQRGDLRVSGNIIKTESRVRVQMECEVLGVEIERNLIMKVNYVGKDGEIAMS